MGEKIIDKKILENYINKYQIDEVFSNDMKPYMHLFKFNKGEHICRVQEDLEYLYFFVSGKAKVYTVMSNGKSLLLCFYIPFKVIGDVEFMYFNKADCSVQAIEETYCVGIAFEHIRKYSIEDSKFLRFICDGLAEKLTRLSKYSSINLLYPLENRVASYILSNKEKNTFKENLTETAELLGASYRHLLRTLNSLCSKSIIRKKKNYYEIIDEEVLRGLAEDLYE
ncbi:cyclic nucleotide-binding domain-containing protein [Clostridium sp. YIM B02506]|uniref:cyclic nucleotide-binding domain-containing protein n=1 Tax=Clostridium sp. YIM B02506 TaxID=2910680 RepID=UPI001EEEE23F|nr:cyclic nucleotide-binding domain-containing protein [Clostridium sp. YIM B02506]